MSPECRDEAGVGGVWRYELKLAVTVFIGNTPCNLAVSLEIGAAVKDFSVSRKLLLLQGSNHRRVVPFVL
ncbi:hypothetical protein C3444_21865 [Escherichia coli]|nr:hypothetical protein [Escherichia coli]EFO1473772.1 hypothetical protein [Escherichia coli]EFO2702943.1 hypothetical protein [Escherichia coli]EFO2713437.1 hypothetical protein [Escherichia coli]EFO3636705.1 hypothetical protein [Escherichia coli]